jgi:uracil-DNA glycosylase family 4
MSAREKLSRWTAGLPPAGSPKLVELRAEIGDCQRCPLKHGRRNLVFGVGPEDARLMVVSEAPGANEDRAGKPFVGVAGKILDRLLMDAFGLGRPQVFLTNTVMCRPPGNRLPDHDELVRCYPFLDAKIAAIRPRAVLLLGSVASRSVLRGRRLGEARGRVFDDVLIGGHAPKIVATYHPAYLARVPECYAIAVEDARLLAGFVADGGAR